MAAEHAGAVVGVAVVGRPVARALQDGATAEVIRLATDGMRNACSMLYGACWRAARALGYRRLITYTLATEPGVSLRAAGWTLIGEAGGGIWSRPSRPRDDAHPTQGKLRWEAPQPAPANHSPQAPGIACDLARDASSESLPSTPTGVSSPVVTPFLRSGGVEVPSFLAGGQRQ